MTGVIPERADDAEITRWALLAGRGDRAALERFLRSTQPQVWRFVAGLSDPQSADDLSQETYLRALRSLPKFKGDSGMATGGRVLHHLEHMLPDDRHTVLIVDYAAAGTRARHLANGAREIKIHGRYVPVRAEVAQIDAFSAHADAAELSRWACADDPPGTIHLVHGEPESAEAPASRLRTARPGMPVSIARDHERVLI